MKLRGAIFDMDGTLVNSLMFWDSLWERMGRTYFNDPSFRPSVEDDRRVRTMIFSDAMEYLRRTYRIPTTEEELLAFANGGVEAFYRDVVTLKPGALALLEHLRREGVKMCLASATEMRYIRQTLARFEIADCFSAVLSCDDLGVGKDRPDIYLLAMENLETSPEETCVFEDSYVALETARTLGCRTVGVYDAYNFGQDRLRAASTVYLGEKSSLTDAIGSEALE